MRVYKVNGLLLILFFFNKFYCDSKISSKARAVGYAFAEWQVKVSARDIAAVK